MKIFKYILIFVTILLFSAGIISYFYPTPYRSNCYEKNLYRYQLGIYQITTAIADQKEYKKIGGIASFLGIKHTVCPEEIEKQHYEKVASSLDSANKALGWHQLREGIWINRNSAIGIREVIALGPEGAGTAENYITQLEFNDQKPLNKIVDLDTFHQLNDYFYKDKNHIYRYYAMAYGGSFSVFEDADPRTFEILSDCYAKDKHHIYEGREGILKNVDYKTFKTKSTLAGCFAKDKYGYLQWGDRINKENLSDEHIREIIKALEQ
ncbi:DKNYY domain-containing protein [Elizabethkingia meningoseptica]|uniref:DKNYY domain-containing protein n=1 Tax=Elizabethkingia meningoseptica TaxID=238 RepID=UPI0023AE7B7E|nr:DKNYY domain-containing protein [Elizabethkingia meningoseptica]MDE5438861.1 DKNYY domain-containing protein [Elizabethkingia meningoseptica]MDE5507996.1 DKNYY domain-containing protein [Elizabethkingia meningoseptica]MDE5517644.1 DKNYY domain-containing protein [Elizabethkingia meningoseptica]MDE5531815.1 DKNYY domain-containing protein [Elizabethkingia meningoseptica]MDE5535366.1 DKNYY domain-containing protein [Elizabethkingia meningoseptica]